MTIADEDTSKYNAVEIARDLFEIKLSNTPKLITKEDGDYLHIHKVLGILSLTHYFYRGYLFLKYGTMKFDASWFTLACILLHMLLSGTSFIFHISQTRIRGAPMIYPEFRLHSIIFAYRSLIVMILQWISLKYQIVTPLYFRIGVVLLTMYAADAVTAAHKDQGTTMRAMPFPQYISKQFRDRLNIFYSVSQIFATGQVLFAHHMDEIFAVVFPIQIAAFLMTCVRKSIISAATWHNFYALSLLSNYVISPVVELNTISTFRNGGFFFPCTVAVILIRFTTRISKYAVWTAVGVAQLYGMMVLNKYTAVVI